MKITYSWFSLRRIVLTCLMWVVGCGTNVPPIQMTHELLPADFALVFHVDGDPNSDRPLRQTSQYVVEPDRAFRAFAGHAAAADYFPNQNRTITRAEFYDLAQHVLANHLMAEPTSPGAHDTYEEVRYEITIVAHGRTHRYSTIPAESPPSVQLLNKLIGLRQPQ